ncbi:dTMP kinase [Stenotrophomonas sp.]|uniref:dTMP kinase n=1 Tax=Stenotrophomonas sp. TaxID=69392 RepID=UPI0028ABB35A|nr:dTMP kinase [Stenotrophomonas sp.]
MPFVSIEGIDGSGKTEQVGHLVARLRNAGLHVVQTKEPDGGQLGAEVRQMMTRPDRALQPIEQMLLVYAARCDHVRSVIRPALELGHWVVSDRFIDSTFAYQVGASGGDLHDLFVAANRAVVGNTIPDLTIILDLPPEIASQRRDQRVDGAVDPAEKLRNFEAIRTSLRTVAAEQVRRCRVIDADQPICNVAAAIWREVQAMRELE